MICLRQHIANHQLWIVVYSLTQLSFNLLVIRILIYTVVLYNTIIINNNNTINRDLVTDMSHLLRLQMQLKLI